jgi:hypothetical protein
VAVRINLYKAFCISHQCHHSALEVSPVLAKQAFVQQQLRLPAATCAGSALQLCAADAARRAAATHVDPAYAVKPIFCGCELCSVQLATAAHHYQQCDRPVMPEA